MFVNRLAILTREIIRMEEMEKGIISIPTEITTEIWACSLVRWNPKEHFSESISKIVVGGSCTAIAKKMKIHPSNLRAPTSISRLKYNANQRRVGSLNSSNTDGFKASTNSQMQFSRQASNTKQRK